MAMKMNDMSREVLIVDDDPFYLYSLQSVLACEGVQTVSARCGEEAIVALKEFPFTTMITDFNMPGMDGLELALIAREFQPGIHIVLMTGDISPDISNLAARAGISRVLGKPCSLAQLKELV